MQEPLNAVRDRLQRMRDSLTTSNHVDPMMLIQDLDLAIDQICHVTARQSDRLDGPTCAGRRVLPTPDGRDEVWRSDTASAGKGVRCASQDAGTDDRRETHARPPTGAVIDGSDSGADPYRNRTTTGTDHVGASGALDCDGCAMTTKVRKQRDDHHTNERTAAIQRIVGRQSICIEQMWDMILKDSKAAELFRDRHTLLAFLKGQSDREGKGVWIETTIRTCKGMGGCGKMGAHGKRYTLLEPKTWDAHDPTVSRMISSEYQKLRRADPRRSASTSS